MRVVVLFPGALGDLCLLAPTLASVVARGARLELSVQRSVAPLATMLLPTVTLGPPIDGAAMATLFGGDVAPAIGAWLAGADRVVAWLARSTNAAELEKRCATFGVSAELHAVPRSDGDRHVSALYAEALGLVDLPLPLRASAPASARPLPWRTTMAPRLVVHPGAGAVTKLWPAEGFLDVARTWMADGGEVAVLLGPAESAATPWWRATGLPLAVDLPLGDAAALVASAPQWIGNDAGMSHVAGALGRQGVVLFGPTRPARWMPLGGALVPVCFAERSITKVRSDVVAALRGNDPRHLA